MWVELEVHGKSSPKNSLLVFLSSTSMCWGQSCISTQVPRLPSSVLQIISAEKKMIISVLVYNNDNILSRHL